MVDDHLARVQQPRRLDGQVLGFGLFGRLKRAADQGWLDDGPLGRLEPGDELQIMVRLDGRRHNGRRRRRGSWPLRVGRLRLRRRRRPVAAGHGR